MTVKSTRQKRLEREVPRMHLGAVYQTLFGDKPHNETILAFKQKIESASESSAEERQKAERAFRALMLLLLTVLPHQQRGAYDLEKLQAFETQLEHPDLNAFKQPLIQAIQIARANLQRSKESWSAEDHPGADYFRMLLNNNYWHSSDFAKLYLLSEAAVAALQYLNADDQQPASHFFSGTFTEKYMELNRPIDRYRTAAKVLKGVSIATGILTGVSFVLFVVAMGVAPPLLTMAIAVSALTVGFILLSLASFLAQQNIEKNVIPARQYQNEPVLTEFFKSKSQNEALATPETPTATHTPM